MASVTNEWTTHFRSRGAALGLTSCLLGTASCGLFSPGPQACTLIGCLNGITVELEALPTGPFKVELLLTSTGAPNNPTYEYECTSGTNCRQSIHFPELLPGYVRVRVTTATGVRTTEFVDVEYVLSYPNGRACPPPCRNATVVVPLPA